MSSNEFKQVMSDISSSTVTSQSQVFKQIKTDQINLRLPMKWILALSEVAGVMSEETGEDFNMQDVIKMCLMEKFGLTL